jgi:hypothetical protein
LIWADAVTNFTIALLFESDDWVVTGVSSLIGGATNARRRSLALAQRTEAGANLL